MASRDDRTPSAAYTPPKQPRKYVEDVEYPEMVFGPDGYWLTCGYCGWDGPVRGSLQEAKRDRWRHPDWFCWLRALWIDYLSPRYGRRWRRG